MMRLARYSSLLITALFWLGPINSQPPAPKLYSDDEIRKLAKHDIDKHYGPALVDIPCLEVVPAGEAFARKTVFKLLNLDDGRIEEFRSSSKGRVVFLTWRVSPSYDISCMSGVLDERDLTDPERDVYGIRLVKRRK